MVDLDLIIIMEYLEPIVHFQLLHQLAEGMVQNMVLAHLEEMEVQEVVQAAAAILAVLELLIRDTLVELELHLLSMEEAEAVVLVRQGQMELQQLAELEALEFLY
jgi:hypothetical protein